MTRRILKIAAFVAAFIIAIVIGTAIGSAGNSTRTVNVPVPGPTMTITGPVITNTVTASPAQPASGQTIGTWSGSGNANTPQFTPPGSGNYVISWQYSGNIDTSFGDNQPTNFTISNTNQSAYSSGFPNDIAVSGHGSTEVTGANGPESFNVTSASGCHWSITVKAAP